MNTSPKIQCRTIEIAQRLEAGSTTEELIKEYSAKWSCSERTIYRLIAFAYDLVKGKICNSEEVLNILRSEVIAEEFENNLLSSLELEAKLCKLAEREDINVRERIQAIMGVLRMRDRHEKLMQKQNETLMKKKPVSFEDAPMSEYARRMYEKV